MISSKPYSKDLRSKAIKYLEAGNRQSRTSKIFKIHRNTLSSWWLRYKEFGIISAKPRLGLRSKLDLKAIAQCVDNNNNCRLIDIGIKFNITTAWASISLRKLGYSYKKKRLPMWKRVEKSEINI